MIIEILKENKLTIGFIYTLSILQYTLHALLPFLLGKAIDGLLQDDKSNLVVLVIANALSIFLGFYLKRYDTRVYMAIFAHKAIKAIQILRRKNVVPSKIASRYQLVGYYSDFFEYSLPQAISAFIKAMTSMVMLFVTNPIIGLINTLIYLITLFIHQKCSRLIQKQDMDIQHIKEDIVQNIMDNKEYEQPIHSLSKFYIKKSNIDATNFLINDSLALIMHLSTILLLVYIHPSIGMVTSTLMYVDQLYGTTYSIFYFLLFVRGVENTNKFINSD